MTGSGFGDASHRRERPGLTASPRPVAHPPREDAKRPSIGASWKGCTTSHVRRIVHSVRRTRPPHQWPRSLRERTSTTGLYRYRSTGQLAMTAERVR